MIGVIPLNLILSRPVCQIRLFRWIQRVSRTLLFLVIAIPIMASAQDWRLQLVSTAWSPFTDVPGQSRFALDLVEEALQRMGVVAETVLVDEARLTPSLLKGEFDGSAALWKDPERERVLMYSQPYLEKPIDSRRAPRQRRISNLTGRPYRQASRPSRRIFIWRGSENHRRADLRWLEQ